MRLLKDIAAEKNVVRSQYLVYNQTLYHINDGYHGVFLRCTVLIPLEARYRPALWQWEHVNYIIDFKVLVVHSLNHTCWPALSGNFAKTWGWLALWKGIKTRERQRQRQRLPRHLIQRGKRPRIRVGPLRRERPLVAKGLDSKRPQRQMAMPRLPKTRDRSARKRPRQPSEIDRACDDHACVITSKMKTVCPYRWSEWTTVFFFVAGYIFIWSCMSTRMGALFGEIRTMWKTSWPCQLGSAYTGNVFIELSYVPSAVVQTNHHSGPL